MPDTILEFSYCVVHDQTKQDGLSLRVDGIHFDIFPNL